MRHWRHWRLRERLALWIAPWLRPEEPQTIASWWLGQIPTTGNPPGKVSFTVTSGDWNDGSQPSSGPGRPAA